MKLCNEDKTKLFFFVSSTSTLDTDHYYNLSRDQVAIGHGAVLEADGMEGSRYSLGTGYGVMREDTGRYLRFLATNKFLRWPTGRGRELSPILVDVARAQALWGVGGRGDAAS